MWLCFTTNGSVFRYQTHAHILAFLYWRGGGGGCVAASNVRNGCVAGLLRTLQPIDTHVITMSGNI